MQTQRDAFWDKIYEKAKDDKDIIIVSADMGAPSLDKFRRDFPNQFVNTGIAEQNAILVGSGLAKEGKTVFVYAIASFLTLNCIEKIRVQNCMMEIPLNIVGVGAGFSYPDSGPTHHLIEDISIMRSLPKMNIFSITDTQMAKDFAENYRELNGINYIRLERQPRENIYSEPQDFDRGFSKIKDGDDSLLISTGIMTHNSLEIASQHKGMGVIDIFRMPVNTSELVKELSKANKIYTLEEHVLNGGLGSYILEIMADNSILKPVKRFGIDGSKGYTYQYGGREALWKHCQIDIDLVSSQLEA